MLADDSLQQRPPSLDPFSFDDIFNLDAPSGGPQPSLGGGSQSSASPRSPFDFTTMPPTPSSSAFITSMPQLAPADDNLFNLFLDEEFTKTPLLPSMASPYEYLSNLSAASESNGIGSGSFPASSSSATSPSPGTYSQSPQPSIGIDPQLVGTPATPKDLSSDFSEEEEEGEEEEREDELLIPTKSVARGKTSRKGTVLSGGVKKASSLTIDNGSSRDPKFRREPAPLKILEPEDWRPSPEEYKKMSSKEKRQLRNKISARNFRVRRKEYISTLEGDIAERDRIIDAVRTELGSSKSENIALREEIAILKKCLLEGRGLADLPPPAELPPSLASSSIHAAASATASTSSSSIVTPNTQKDLPTSPRLGSRPFWGGLGGMGVTPVHTTFIPPISVLADKASTPGSPILQPSIFYEETLRSRALQENINPGLNAMPPRNLIEKKGAASFNPALSPLTSIANAGAFDAFADTNPFTLKSLDAYRMQLWGKMASQQSTAHGQQPYPQSPTPPYSPPLGPSGFASGLRPHFFTTPTKAAGTLSPSSPPPAPSHPAPSREHAALAALASQTLLGKLGQAFWDAFSGSSPSSMASSPHTPAGAISKQWDAEKVRKVLEGRAVVRVVDLDHAPSAASSSSASPSSVSPSSPPTPSAQRNVCERSKSAGQCSLTDILEESMRSLTLGKKSN